MIDAAVETKHGSSKAQLQQVGVCMVQIREDVLCQIAASATAGRTVVQGATTPARSPSSSPVVVCIAAGCGGNH